MEVNEVSAPSGLSVIGPEEFKLAFRYHPAGVTVITADAGDGPVGLTATSVSSLSAEPPILVFSISNLSSSAPTILKAETLVVHFLRADELEVARLFATSGIDRFADRSIWDRLATGEPYLLGSSQWIRGRVLNRIVAGQSTLVVVEAREAFLSRPDAAPLVYHDRAWHYIGEHSRLPETDHR